MSCLESLARSHARVEVLTEISTRYGKVIGGLLEALAATIPDLDEDARRAAEAAGADAAAQLTAIADVAAAGAADLG